VQAKLLMGGASEVAVACASTAAVLVHENLAGPADGTWRFWRGEL
jgi:hypothetical protein